MAQPPTLLVVGSLNMDLVVEVARHPAPGDTVLGGDVARFPGGKGANQAAAAARAGASVRMIGRVGTDAYGTELVAALGAPGVDTGKIGVHAGPSGMAFITVSASGENTIVVSPGANRHLSSAALSGTDLDDIGLVLTQLETPLDTLYRLADLASARGVPLAVNAAPAQLLPSTLLEQITYLIVNEGEAALLSGQAVTDSEGLKAAAQTLLAHGVSTVIVTLGERGVYWRAQGEARGTALPAYRVEVVDTTAAGDAFCGALAAALVAGEPLATALRRANAAGALATTRAGAQPSLPSAAEINALLRIRY